MSSTTSCLGTIILDNIKKENMRKGIMSIVQESIAFQNGKLFEELTEAVTKLSELSGSDLPDIKFFTSDEAANLLALLKRHTGITFNLFNGEEEGPSMRPPNIGYNHLFVNDYSKHVKKWLTDFDSFKDVRSLVNALEQPIVSGTVDLKNAKVSGVFGEMEIGLFMPRSIFLKNGPITDAEVAAIILHEVGHAFTYMEFLSRSVTTNQALAGMVRALDDSIPSDKRELVFITGAKLLSMTKEQTDALSRAKSKNEVSYIVLDAAVRESVSELGVSIYDAVSCEYLADQFATRFGAGRELVTSLDKFRRNSGWEKWEKPSGYYLVSAIKLVASLGEVIFKSIMTFGMIWLVLLFSNVRSQSKRGFIYDKDKSRFLRIKHQNIERLKDKDISLEEKNKLIANNETIDMVCKYYNDNLTAIEKLAYYFRPEYRNAHKYEILQKDLELMASSDLFTHAAKLSTL